MAICSGQYVWLGPQWDWSGMLRGLFMNVFIQGEHSFHPVQSYVNVA